MKLLYIPLLLVVYLLMRITGFDQMKKDAQYYFRRAEMEREKGEFKSAYKDYSKAISLNEIFLDAWQKRGLLKMDMDSAQSAVNDFDKAIQITPSGELYYWRASAKIKSNDSTGACNDYQSACDLGHNRSCDLYRECKK